MNKCVCAARVSIYCGVLCVIDVKKRFLRFFYFAHVFRPTLFNVLYFLNVFLFLKKNVGKVQSGKQIKKKHFQK